MEFWSPIVYAFGRRLPVAAPVPISCPWTAVAKKLAIKTLAIGAVTSSGRLLVYTNTKNKIPVSREVALTEASTKPSLNLLNYLLLALQLT